MPLKELRLDERLDLAYFHGTKIAMDSNRSKISTARASNGYSDLGVESPINTPLINNGRLAAEPQGVNKCLCDGFATETTGIVKTGDGVLSIIDGSFQLDNSNGVTDAIVIIDGATVNTNTHVMSCTGYSYAGTPKLITSDGLNEIAFDSKEDRISVKFTPSSGAVKIGIKCESGDIARFKLPQLEESFLSTVIPATLSGGTRSATTESSVAMGSRSYELLTDPQPYVQVEWKGRFGANQSAITTNLSVLSTNGSANSLIYATPDGLLNTTDGINTASVAMNFISGRDYTITVDATPELKIGYSDDAGGVWRYSAAVNMDGVLQSGELIQVPYCGAGPEIPIETRFIEIRKYTTDESTESIYANFVPTLGVVPDEGEI
jgi:hypothetical protein